MSTLGDLLPDYDETTEYVETVKPKYALMDKIRKVNYPHGNAWSKKCRKCPSDKYYCTHHEADEPGIHYVTVGGEVWCVWSDDGTIHQCLSTRP